DCSGCGLVPYPGYEKAKATLQALTSAGVRQRYELWHSIALLSCILIWILNFVMMSLSTRILTQGPLFYVSVAIFFVPFLALLFAVTTPTGAILNFTSDIPHLQGV